MEIRTETIITGACALTVVSLMIANIFVPSKKDGEKSPILCTTNICMLLAILFILLPFAFIQVYSVQCMLDGGCDKFVRISIGFAILFTVVYIGLFVWKLIKQRN